MKLTHSSTQSIVSGFDRQHIHTLKRRFHSVNAARFQRMLESLNPRQQHILKILPLLFHCNHPALPGFVSRHTPAKICNFKATKKELTLVRSIARSFKPHYDASQPEQIVSLFVMGSVGTIAQSKRSDLDFWLCHHDDLSTKQCADLNQKAERIAIWARQFDLDMHFFLMNDEAFRKGKLSSLDAESSGSAQRLLLLDEFYRSSILLAGRQPLWWFMHESEERHYQENAHTLLAQRFIQAREVIDFGSVTPIPEGEFIGAGIWQLYKAIDSPYKSVLKLLLLETYVNEYPNIRPLSLDFKKQIFDGDINIEDLDSYVMVYRRIEKYLLEKNQGKRLELARRCFYFKVNRALSRSSKRCWQLELLRTFVSEWGWTNDALAILDSRHRWKAPKVVEERALLVNELNHSYQFLLEFAQQTGSTRAISNEELVILGRKLQAKFERRPGKIEWLNPNISASVAEPSISFVKLKSKNSEAKWRLTALSDHDTRAPSLYPLHESSSLVELMLWAKVNCVMDGRTKIDLNDAPELSQADMSRLRQKLANWVDGLGKAGHEDFKSASKPLKVFIVINAGELVERASNTQIISERGDPFNYGANNISLIRSIDMISVNTWREIHNMHFAGPNALLDASKAYLDLDLPSRHRGQAELSIACIAQDLRSLITQRVERWFGDIQRCFLRRNSRHKRYIFSFAKRQYILHIDAARTELEAYANDEQLLSSLTRNRTAFSGLHTDSQLQTRWPLSLIAHKMKRNTISVFYRLFDHHLETFIADEKGSLFRALTPNQSQHTPLVPLHRFLRAVIARQARSQPELLADFGICPIYFYQLVHTRGGKLTLSQTAVSQNIEQARMFGVTAIARQSRGNGTEHGPKYSQTETLNTHLITNEDSQKPTIHYDFVCDGQGFSYTVFKQQLFLVVAQFVLSRRRSGHDYPIYITDLDLSEISDTPEMPQELQVCNYLHIKSELENRLNKAIAVLLQA